MHPLTYPPNRVPSRACNWRFGSELQVPAGRRLVQNGDQSVCAHRQQLLGAGVWGLGQNSMTEPGPMTRSACWWVRGAPQGRARQRPTLDCPPSLLCDPGASLPPWTDPARPARPASQKRTLAAPPPPKTGTRTPGLLAPCPPRRGAPEDHRALLRGPGTSLSPWVSLTPRCHLWESPAGPARPLRQKGTPSAPPPRGAAPACLWDPLKEIGAARAWQKHAIAQHCSAGAGDGSQSVRAAPGRNLSQEDRPSPGRPLPTLLHALERLEGTGRAAPAPGQGTMSVASRRLRRGPGQRWNSGRRRGMPRQRLVPGPPHARSIAGSMAPSRMRIPESLKLPGI
nr:hypothetical protein CFP56_78553 [Quercus suber]